MSKQYCLGIDVGTSSTKVLLVSTAGKVVAEADASYPLYSPRPQWSEQEPDDWWRAVQVSVRSVVRKAKAKPESIVAIGLSGQMHGSVFLDDKDRPLRPALLWNDQRTEVECTEMIAAMGGVDALVAETHNTVLTGFTAPKLLWFRKHEPKRFAKLKTLLLPKDYIRLQLTGERTTDVTDASGTGLFDVKRRVWSETVLRKLQLDESLFPRAVESVTVTGKILPSVARQLGLRAGTSVVGGAGDQPAAAIGLGVIEEGMVSATIGTSGVVFAASRTVVSNPGGVLQSFCHAVPGEWCAFGCMLSAGASLEWLRTLTPSRKLDLATLLRAAERAQPGSGDLLFLPYLDGERCPHPDPSARGAWVGLHRGQGYPELARSVVEGITFGMRDVLELLKQRGLNTRVVRISGGATRSAFWRQLQSDIYGIPTVAMETPNASALGAALLAGTGAGIWKDIPTACRAANRSKSKLKPRALWARFYEERYASYAALYPKLSSKRPNPSPLTPATSPSGRESLQSISQNA